MSDEESKKTTEEASVGANADAAGSASAAGSAGLNASSKKTSEEKKKPKKLGQKAQQKDAEKSEEKQEETPESTPQKMENRSQSRKGSRSRGRGRPQSQPPSDTDSAYRSDVSQKPKRQRNRNRNKSQGQVQEQEEKGGGGGPLEGIDEVGETVDGVTDTVQDTAGKALSKPHEAIGGLLKGGKKGGKEGEKEEEDEGENEQLRLRLDLNLDIEVQLKAKIHGDLTLGLLYVVLSPFSINLLTVLQELISVALSRARGADDVPVLECILQVLPDLLKGPSCRTFVRSQVLLEINIWLIQYDLVYCCSKWSSILAWNGKRATIYVLSITVVLLSPYSYTPPFLPNAMRHLTACGIFRIPTPLGLSPVDDVKLRRLLHILWSDMRSLQVIQQATYTS